MTDTNLFNVLEVMRGSFVSVTLKGSGTIKRNLAYQEGKETVAIAKGGDADAFNVSMKLYPKGFDAEITALTKAFAAVRSHFYEGTLPFGNDGAGRAEGARLLTTDGILQGRFMVEHQRLLDELDTARTNFATEIHSIVSAIHASGKLGSDFNWDNYPNPGDIYTSYTYAPIEDTMEFLHNPADLAGVRLDSKLAERISSTMAQRAMSQYRFGLQSEAKKLLAYLDTMSANLGELVAHRTGADTGSTRTKAPRIHDSLVGNVKEAVEKLKTYAVPETSEGSALLELADKVEESLSLDRLTADHLKNSVQLAEKAGKRAGRLAETLRASLQFDMDAAVSSLDM